MARIDTRRGRDTLIPRAEPYWHKLSRGRYLGFRKTASGPGGWIARLRDEQGAQRYQALGEITDAFGFDQAKEAAEQWMRDAERGVTGRHEDGSRVTVGTACLSYVRSLRAEGRPAAAHDAHLRFRRTVYGDAGDEEFGPPGRGAIKKAPAEALARATSQPNEPRTVNGMWLPIAQAIASIPLAKIRAPRIKQWHVELVSLGLSKASANRTLTALKAALNRAVADRAASAEVAQEWAEVAPLKRLASTRPVS